MHYAKRHETDANKHSLVFTRQDMPGPWSKGPYIAGFRLPLSVTTGPDRQLRIFLWLLFHRAWLIHCVP